jgi:N-acetylneuraminate synthase
VSRTLIIAEAGVNHDGNLAKALELVRLAAEAGADIVKFQTFTADRLVTPTAAKAAYQIETTGAGESQWAMLKRLELSVDDYRALIVECERCGVEFLSTPFDEGAADLLAELGVRRFKIPSGEATNLPFLAHVARFGKPVILSTGMCDLDEVAAAVATIRANGDPPLTILHCVTAYPAAAADCNLRAMATMASAFGVPVGFSDHTVGCAVGWAAVALGARVIEKHFTYDPSAEGPDHRASLAPAELTAFVAGIRAIESALGDGVKRPVAEEVANIAAARKSVVTTRAIAAGTAFAAADLAVRRPGTGFPPAALAGLIGRRAARDLPAFEPVGPDAVEAPEV